MMLRDQRKLESVDFEISSEVEHSGNAYAPQIDTSTYILLPSSVYNLHHRLASKSEALLPDKVFS
jgi:hypothetical protein